MSEVIYERIKKNLEILNMKNTALILDNYLEKAIHDKKISLKFLIICWQRKQKQRKTEQLGTRLKCPDFHTERLWNSSILIFSQA